MSTTSEVLIGRDAGGPATEVQLARALVKAGLVAGPVAIVLAGLAFGASGAASVGFALALVLANFAASAALLAWAARISYGLVMGVALFGFLVRMALVAAAVLAVRGQSWVHPVPLGVTLVVAHLGLLAWEARSVSATLAFPGLKP